MDDGLQLTLFGKPEVSRNGVPVTGWVYQKSLALLCYLAVTGQSHTRIALAGLLWGEASEANARAGLRKSLADLRCWVAPHLNITRKQVTFDRALPYWVDVEVFDRRVSELLRMIERDGALSEEDTIRLAEAIELYRGDFLEGFHVRQAPAFEEWALLTRERLRLSVLRALDALATHYTARGAYADGIAYLERLLAMVPEQEEAHRQLMSLLALSGQKGAALRQYKHCCRVLMDELGVEPENETKDLYVRICAGSELDVHFRSPQHKLPIPSMPLIGRNQELTRILAYLQDPTCRQLTLIGLGGSGKTHLALEAAAVLMSNGKATIFPDGVFFVPLAPLESTEAIVPMLAQSLGFHFYEKHKPRDQLLDFLRKKRLLLVLDNFEHLLDGVDLVTDILEASPGIKILATSRASLRIQREQLFPITGMDCPHEMTENIDDFQSFAAVELFLKSALRIQPDLNLTDDDIADVARICCLVEGLPLGILLAASWMRILTPAEIADRLSGENGPAVYGSTQGLDILDTEWRDVPARQRSMRAVFDLSWNLLTEREQMTFAALSVFRGGFTLQAACHVSGGSLRQLMVLVDQSLLQRVAPRRYTLHELLRQYAEKKLSQVSESHSPLSTESESIAPNFASQVCDRHSAYYCAALHKWSADLKSSRQQGALAEMEVEIPNARAAWDWIVENGQATQMTQAMDGLCDFYMWYGRYEEGFQVCRAAVERLSETSSPSEVSAENGWWALARVLAWKGVFSSLLGRNDRAVKLLRQSLTFLEKYEPVEREPYSGLFRDVQSEKAFATWQLGKVMFDVDRGQSGPLYQQSLNIYQTLDDRWRMASVLEDLAWIARYEGNYERARQLGEQDLVLRRKLEDPQGISRSLRQVSAIAYRQGRLEEAEDFIRESCSIPLAEQNQVERANRLSGSGWILTMLGQFLEGHSWLEKSVSIWNDLGISHMVAYMSIPLGYAKMHLGMCKEGCALAQAGFDAARERGDGGRMGFALFTLGWLALMQREYTEALAYLQESASLFRSDEARDQVSEILALLGYAARGLGQCSQARHFLCEALQIATKLEVFLPVMFALPAVSLLCYDQNETERAVELYGLALRYPFVANSCWFEDVVGRSIAVAASSLPSEISAAARERVSKRGLQATAAMLLTELVS